MCFCLSNISTLFAQSRIYFPHEPNFTLGSQPNAWVKTGDATWTIEGLELTSNQQNKFGAAALDLAKFDATHEIIITFEYSMIGSNNPGDGFSFFLYDGDVLLDIGGYGRGLGYTKGENETVGLNGAYLGIGFDVFGNFKERFTRTLNNASIFIPGFLSSLFNNGSGSSQRNSYKNHITLRAGTNKTSTIGQPVIYNRTNHYPVLYSVTTQTPTNVNSNTSNSNKPTYYTLLNQSTGAITTGKTHGTGNSTTSTIPSFNPFTLATTGNNFNKVKLTLSPPPIEDSTTGMLISLEVTVGSNTYTILKNFKYNKVVKYKSSDQSSGSDDSVTIPPPDSFKLGFAGSTGASTQRHLIKNVKITLPYMPEANNDFKETCFNMATEWFDPFANDLFYRKVNSTTYQNGNVSANSWSTNTNNPSYIDRKTFQFLESEIDDGEDDDLVLTNDISVYQENVGTWTYDLSEGKVRFNPINGFYGEAVIYYTAKGFSNNSSPFAHKNYRSRPAKITAKVNRCGIVVNPQLPNSGIIRSGK